MIVRTLKAQAPDLIAIVFALNGRLDLVDGSRVIAIAPRFTAPAVLIARLGELAKAHHAKRRERRFMQAFRERHYELLRAHVELRRKLGAPGGQPVPSTTPMNGRLR
jgi:hypothetical protein